MFRKRAALVGVNALLLGAIAAGCGDSGDSGDSDKASDDKLTVDQMCQEFKERIDSGKSDDYGDIKAFILDLHERGLPDKAPQDARDGLDAFYDVVKDAGTEAEADAAASNLPEDKRSSTSDFTSWVEEECGAEAPSPTVPTDLGTDLPTDIPTDVPSLDPSELPTDLESIFPSGVPSELQSLLPSE